MVKIQTQNEPDYQIIEVDGEIDASSSIHLDNVLKSASESKKSILVDLEKLDYISSAGLGVFISYLETLKSNEITFIIFGLQDKVREVFEILGLQQLMIISKNKKEAIALLNGA